MDALGSAVLALPQKGHCMEASPAPYLDEGPFPAAGRTERREAAARRSSLMDLPEFLTGAPTCPGGDRLKRRGSIEFLYRADYALSMTRNLLKDSPSAGSNTPEAVPSLSSSGHRRHSTAYLPNLNPDSSDTTARFHRLHSNNNSSGGGALSPSARLNWAATAGASGGSSWGTAGAASGSNWGTPGASGASCTPNDTTEATPGTLDWHPALSERTSPAANPGTATKGMRRIANRPARLQLADSPSSEACTPMASNPNSLEPCGAATPATSPVAMPASSSSSPRFTSLLNGGLSALRAAFHHLATKSPTSPTAKSSPVEGGPASPGKQFGLGRRTSQVACMPPPPATHATPTTSAMMGGWSPSPERSLIKAGSVRSKATTAGRVSDVSGVGQDGGIVPAAAGCGAGASTRGMMAWGRTDSDQGAGGDSRGRHQALSASVPHLMWCPPPPPPGTCCAGDDDHQDDSPGQGLSTWMSSGDVLASASGDMLACTSGDYML